MEGGFSLRNRNIPYVELVTVADVPIPHYKNFSNLWR